MADSANNSNQNQPTSRALDADRLKAHIQRLFEHTHEQFPNRSLPQYQANLINLASEVDELAQKLRRNGPLDFLLPGLVIFLALLIATTVFSIFRNRLELPDSFLEALEPLEASANLAVLVIALTYFVSRTLTERRRSNALSLLHRVRSQIHILDMTQLGKNLQDGPPADLDLAGRIQYLDLCSQTVSLTAKVGALIIKDFEDPVVISTVTEIETLSTGLSQKIWLKISVLRADERASRRHTD